jgi:hypothetical protein
MLLIPRVIEFEHVHKTQAFAADDKVSLLSPSACAHGLLILWPLQLLTS